MFGAKEKKAEQQKGEQQGQDTAQKAAAEVPVKQAEVATQKPQHPAAKLDYGHLAGQSNVGMEDADRDSFAIPFLVILQKMSPQLDRNDPEYISEAREG